MDILIKDGLDILAFLLVVYMLISTYFRFRNNQQQNTIVEYLRHISETLLDIEEGDAIVPPEGTEKSVEIECIEVRYTADIPELITVMIDDEGNKYEFLGVFGEPGDTVKIHV